MEALISLLGRNVDTSLARQRQERKPEIGFEQNAAFNYHGNSKMKPNRAIGVTLAAAIASIITRWPAFGAETAATEALTLHLPAPTMKGTPEDLPKGPNIDPLTDKPRPPFLVPKGVTNAALGKPVTSSVPPFTGELNQVTDGKKEAFD